MGTDADAGAQSIGCTTGTGCPTATPIDADPGAAWLAAAGNRAADGSTALVRVAPLGGTRDPRCTADIWVPNGTMWPSKDAIWVPDDAGIWVPDADSWLLGAKEGTEMGTEMGGETLPSSGAGGLHAPDSDDAVGCAAGKGLCDGAANSGSVWSVMAGDI